MIDSLEAASVLKIIKETEKIRRLGQESSTWSLFGADWRSKKWSVLGLASEWRFEKGDRKSDSGSSESEY